MHAGGGGETPLSSASLRRRGLIHDASRVEAGRSWDVWMEVAPTMLHGLLIISNKHYSGAERGRDPFELGEFPEEGCDVFESAPVNQPRISFHRMYE